MRAFVIIAFLLAGSAYAESSVWKLDDWAGPAIDVWSFEPDNSSADTPVVIVMHGWSRDVERYFNDWRTLGEQHGFIVAVPYFPKKAFPSSWHYNQGHVFAEHSTFMRPRDEWTFSVIEKVFDRVIARTASERPRYTIFGHSAGSQFVHRFLYYMPNARVDRYLAANAGWYTMPDFNTGYPYGLRKSRIDEDQIRAAFGKDMVLLLGKEDTDQADPSLRNTPEAKRQGKNRFVRGLTYFSVARITAEKLNTELKWRVVVVEDAGHVNGQMAPAAAKLVR